MKKLKTIQSELFFTFSFIIITLLSVIFSAFYFWTTNILKANAFASKSDQTQACMDKIDDEITSMDDVSTNVCYSNLVKDKFEEYMKFSKKYASISNSVNAASELTDMLVAIIGPSRPVQQIYLYNLKNMRFGTGFYNSQDYTSARSKSWYNEVVKESGGMVISKPQKDFTLSRVIATYSNMSFISICRMYYNSYGISEGIVEVEQYYNTVFSVLNEELKENGSNEHIYVYDSSGNAVYPYPDKSKVLSSFYYKYCRSPDNIVVINPKTHISELLIRHYSKLTGWTILEAVSQDSLFSPLYSFTKVLLLGAVSALFIALLFSFFAAKKYTQPIKRLCSTLKSSDINDFSKDAVITKQNLNSGIIELEELNNALYKSRLKIKMTLDKLFLSQAHELQSQILALQSQMNPHFLFNTLATIDAMAEEGMTEQIMQICQNYSSILRYISSNDSSGVTIGTEIQYTEKYLDCMKIRYGNRLFYESNISDGVVDEQIPKLSIQPLVENALKHGIKSEYPCKICIKAYKQNDFWRIDVIDNGTGISDSSLESIKSKIALIEKTGISPNLNLNGMGLINIYIRLNLIYKKDMIFEISKNPHGGTIVSIGGKLDFQEVDTE